jgi:hypothetical protein
MPSLVPGIYVFLKDMSASKTWIAGTTSPAMTKPLFLRQCLSPKIIRLDVGSHPSRACVMFNVK